MKLDVIESNDSLLEMKIRPGRVWLSAFGFGCLGVGLIVLWSMGCDSRLSVDTKEIRFEKSLLGIYSIQTEQYLASDVSEIASIEAESWHGGPRIRVATSHGDKLIDFVLANEEQRNSIVANSLRALASPELPFHYDEHSSLIAILLAICCFVLAVASFFPFGVIRIRVQPLEKQLTIEKSSWTCLRPNTVTVSLDRLVRIEHRTMARSTEGNDVICHEVMLVCRGADIPISTHFMLDEQTALKTLSQLNSYLGRV